jgi:hypothetical protein
MGGEWTDAGGARDRRDPGRHALGVPTIVACGEPHDSVIEAASDGEK